MLTKNAEGLLNPMRGCTIFFIRLRRLRILSLELGGWVLQFLSLELGWVLRFISLELGGVCSDFCHTWNAKSNKQNSPKWLKTLYNYITGSFNIIYTFLVTWVWGCTEICHGKITDLVPRLRFIDEHSLRIMCCL